MIIANINGKERSFCSIHDCATVVRQTLPDELNERYADLDSEELLEVTGTEWSEKYVFGILPNDDTAYYQSLERFEQVIKDNLIYQKHRDSLKSWFDISDEELFAENPPEPNYEIDADKYPDIPELKLHGQEFLDAVGATYEIVPADDPEPFYMAWYQKRFKEEFLKICNREDLSEPWHDHDKVIWYGGKPAKAAQYWYDRCRRLHMI